MEQSLRDYCESVICTLSDQGTLAFNSNSNSTRLDLAKLVLLLGQALTLTFDLMIQFSRLIRLGSASSAQLNLKSNWYYSTPSVPPSLFSMPGLAASTHFNQPTAHLHFSVSGTELKLGDAVNVSVAEICRDRSLDILQALNVEPRELEAVRSQGHGNGPGGLPLDQSPYFPGWKPHRTGSGALEEDVPALEMPVQNQELERLPPEGPGQCQDQGHVNKLFPNSLRLSGVKHICDNALSSILNDIPGCLDS